MIIRVVISGRGYDVADAVPEELSLDDGCSLDEALQAIAESLPEGRRLAESCLVAVSGKHLGTLRYHQAQRLKDGDELMLIAPVAGG